MTRFSDAIKNKIQYKSIKSPMYNRKKNWPGLFCKNYL